MRAYTVVLEYGDDLLNRSYLVVANTATEAEKKAKTQAVKDTAGGVAHGWRLIRLEERPVQLVT